MICIDELTETYVECPTTQQSTVIVNGINHDTASVLQVNIPAEFERDYTNTWDVMTINISWYNVDDEYIENVIAQTELTPTAEDMSTMINGLQVYLPYFFIGLICIFFLWLVKKFFRS